MFALLSSAPDTLLCGSKSSDFKSSREHTMVLLFTMDTLP